MKYFYAIILLIVNSCISSKNNDEYLQLKKTIDSVYNPLAIFEIEHYEKILQELQNPKYTVLPIYKMKDYYNSNKVVVGIKHDVDCHIFKAQKIAELEKNYNIASTYYILPTATYFGKIFEKKFIKNDFLDPIYKKIYKLGHEIGIHNDLLTVWLVWNLDYFLFNQYCIKTFTDQGIPIYGTSSHGSSICREIQKANYEIFSDFCKEPQKIVYKNKEYTLGQKSLNEMDYKYEAYHINYNIYFSDTGGKWHISTNSKSKLDEEESNKNTATFEEVLQTLKKTKPGDRVIFLIHPLWWKIQE